MSDILFKCTKCASALTCEVAEVDKTLPCSGCGQPVRVPKPDFAFRCEHCQADLCAPRSSAGEKFACPGCETEVVVPARATPNLAVRRPATPQNGIPSGRPAGVFAAEPAAAEPPPATGRQCPKCGGDVAPAAIICVNCGVNLITGKKIGQRASPSTAAIGSFLGAIALPLILVGLGLGGWYYWDYRNQEAERIKTEQQQAAATAKAEKLRLEKAQVEALKEQKRKEEQAKAEQEIKAKAAQRSANIEHCRMLYCDSSKIALFDALTLLSSESDQRIAIDPDAVDAMIRIRVDFAAVPAVKDPTALADFLGRYRLVIRKCSVSDKSAHSVDLVTTEQIWAYSQASHLLSNRQIDQAYQVLNNAIVDSSSFGIHCQSLRSVLANMRENRDELTKLASQVKETTTSCLSNYKNSRTAARSANVRLKSTTSMQSLGGSAEPAAMVAQQRYEQSLEELHDATRLLGQFTKKMALDNQVIWLRHLDANNAQLYTESLALLDIMIENFVTLKNLCDGVDKLIQTMSLSGPQQAQASSSQETSSPQKELPWQEEVKTISKSLGDLPPFLLDRQRMLRESVRFSADRLTAIFPQKGPPTGIVDGLKFANEAFASDRGNLMARAAVGYFRVQWQAKAANDIFRDGTASDTAKYEEIAREFRDKRKEEMLRTALELAGRTNSTIRVDSSETKIGTAIGLCVWNANGALFPLSARIAPSLPSTVSEGKSDTYWGRIETLVRNKLAEMPIAFGDYGYKDMYVCMSAIEVYKWLCIVNTNRVPGLHIEFQDLEFGKAGDSAGVTIAVAANSSLTKRSIRQDVAMTGSFRSDGSVQPVGSIFEKVDGAVASPLIETVLLPKGNEADGLLVPIDKLCRVVIISGEDVQTYIKYATDPNYNMNALASLRKAQVLILGGQWERAESILVEVATDCPESYTARRLLELIAFWKKMGQEKIRFTRSAADVNTSAVAEHVLAQQPVAIPVAAVPPATLPTTGADHPQPSSKPASPTLKKPASANQAGSIRRLGQ